MDAVLITGLRQRRQPFDVGDGGGSVGAEHKRM